MARDDKGLRAPIDSAPQSPITPEVDSSFSLTTTRTSLDLFKFRSGASEKPIILETTQSVGESLNDHVATLALRLPVWRQWIVEISLSVTSLCAFIIIVAVLAAYNDRALPRLPLQITLNTFLAFFTTFTKAAFMIPISEALSQWKWNIYASALPSRPLADFQVLDAASRGVWGSWMLFRNFKWNHFVSFAAILSTLSLFTSPITQQMITYSTRSTPDPTGRAQIAFSRNARHSDTIPDWIRRNNLNTLGSRADSPVPPLPPTCTATNCTFEQYTSLAICMKMADISSHLTVTKIPNSTPKDWSMGEDWLPAVTEGNGTPNTTAWNASLPNGMTYITPLSYAFITWPFGGSMADSIAFHDSPDLKFNSLSNHFHIYSAAGNVSHPSFNRTSDPTPWKFYAFEILYYSCVNTYSTVYSSGTATTTILSSFAAPFDGTIPNSQQQSLPTYNSGCYYPPGLENDLGSGDMCEHIEKPGTFTALADPHDPSKAYVMDRYVGATITGELFYKARNTYVGDGVATHRGVSSGAGADAVKEALWGAAQQGNFTAREREDRLRAFMGGFATSLSNGLRTAAGDSQLLKGVAWSPETFIHINWGWASFLAAQMLFSYLFLAVTIFRTYRLGVPVLKSSELASILAPTDAMRSAIGTIGNLDDAEKQARVMHATLDGSGRRLVLAGGGSGNG